MKTDAAEYRYYAEKERDKKVQHKDDILFLRSTTDIGKENTTPAKVALTHLNSQTTGLARVAVLAKISGTNNDKLYVGAGLHRDDSSATKVNSSDVRLGYRRVFEERPEKIPDGVEQVFWTSVARSSDHIKDSMSYRLDAGYDWSRRWYKPIQYDQVKFDRLVRFKINPFSDRTHERATGLKSSTSGIGIGFDFSWYRPTDVDWLPDSSKSYLPDRWNFSSLRNIGSAGTDQYSTMNRLGFKWELASSESARMQPSITLAREVGSNFREGLAHSAKTLLTLDVKFN